MVDPAALEAIQAKGKGEDAVPPGKGAGRRRPYSLVGLTAEGSAVMAGGAMAATLPRRLVLEALPAPAGSNVP